jgi:hypothetical protein
MLHHELLFNLKNFLGLSGPFRVYQSYTDAFPSFNSTCADIERNFMQKTGDIAFHYHEKQEKSLEQPNERRKGANGPGDDDGGI